jgi:hypothetical protein
MMDPKFHSQIERDLYAYLSEPGKDEFKAFLESLEDDAPMECANCNCVIGDHASFCGEKCKEEFMSEPTSQADTPSNLCPQQTGAGMGFIGGSK